MSAENPLPLAGEGTSLVATIDGVVTAVVPTMTPVVTVTPMAAVMPTMTPVVVPAAMEPVVVPMAAVVAVMAPVTISAARPIGVADRLPIVADVIEAIPRTRRTGGNRGHRQNTHR
jgi:hypothetical protein